MRTSLASVGSSMDWGHVAKAKLRSALRSVISTTCVGDPWRSRLSLATGARQCSSGVFFKVIKAKLRLATVIIQFSIDTAVVEWIDRYLLVLESTMQT